MHPNGELDAQVVVDAFAGVARRIVAISSGDVYRAYGRIVGTEPGPPDPVPLREDSPLREKLYPYRGDTPRTQGDPERWIDDYDKILVERVVMGNGDLPGTILRLPQVYGPGDRQHRLFTYLEKMDNHDPTIALDEGTANWRWQRGYVENVADAIALATMDERAAGRIYNVGEPDALTEQEWIKQIGQAAGWVGEVVIVPRKQLKTTYDTNQHMVYDTSALRGDLGYVELVPQDEALRRTIAWDRAHGPENRDPK
jgi:nucleoside-diphosphate-sugar epimerase